MSEMNLEGPIQEWDKIVSGTGTRGKWFKRSFKISNTWVGIFSDEEKLKQIVTVLPPGTHVNCIAVHKGKYVNLKSGSLTKSPNQPDPTKLTPKQETDRADTGKPTQAAPIRIYDNNGYWQEKHEIDKMVHAHLALKGAGDVALALMKMSKDKKELDKNLALFKETQKNLFTHTAEVTQNLALKRVYDGRWLMGFSGNLDQYDKLLADMALEKIKTEKEEQSKLENKEPEPKTEIEEIKADGEIKSVDELDPILS